MYFPCFIYTVRVDVTISSLDQTTVKYQEVVRIYIVYLTEYGDKSAHEREREREISASFIKIWNSYYCNHMRSPASFVNVITNDVYNLYDTCLPSIL